MSPDLDWLFANSLPEPNSGCWLWGRGIEWLGAATPPQGRAGRPADAGAASMKSRRGENCGEIGEN